LATLIAAARRELSLKAKRPVTRAVASVPLGHGPAARAAMLQAVEAAGLELLRLVEAPVAAALALELEARGDHDYLWLARGVAGFEAGVIAVDGGSVRLAGYDLADRLEGLGTFVGAQTQVVGLLLDHVTPAEAASLSTKPILPNVDTDRSIVIGAALMAEALAG
jgi:molecular chaperone DnaK (HSP70)